MVLYGTVPAFQDPEIPIDIYIYIIYIYYTLYNTMDIYWIYDDI